LFEAGVSAVQRPTNWRVFRWSDDDGAALRITRGKTGVLRDRGVMELAWAGCDDDKTAADARQAGQAMIRRYAGAAYHTGQKCGGEARMNGCGPKAEPDNASDVA